MVEISRAFLIRLILLNLNLKLEGKKGVKITQQRSLTSLAKHENMNS
jgi:hypothetical protein